MSKLIQAVCKELSEAALTTKPIGIRPKFIKDIVPDFVMGGEQKRPRLGSPAYEKWYKNLNSIARKQEDIRAGRINERVSMSDLDADLDERIEDVVDNIKGGKYKSHEIAKKYTDAVKQFIADYKLTDPETTEMIRKSASEKFHDKIKENDEEMYESFTQILAMSKMLFEGVVLKETKEASDQTIAEFDHQVKALAGIVRKLKINGQMSGGTIALIRTATTDLEKIVRRLK